MFFHMELQKNMQLRPSFFGPNLKKNLISQLTKQVEGTCNGRHGFIVAITNVTSTEKGKLLDGSAFATFPVKYNSNLSREKFLKVVTTVNKMGFFADAGPVTIFVSNHLVPEDMEFQHGDTPKYVNSDGSVKIETGSEVRLMVIGTRTDATSIFCIGSIMENFLGVINDPSVY